MIIECCIHDWFSFLTPKYDVLPTPTVYPVISVIVITTHINYCVLAKFENKKFNNGFYRMTPDKAMINQASKKFKWQSHIIYNLNRMYEVTKWLI